MVSTKSFLFSALLFDILAMGTALLFGFMEEDFRKYFGEHYPITWLCSVQLIIISGLSWSMFKSYKVKSNPHHNWRSPHIIWAIIAVAFLFLACDEKSGIHEALERLIFWSLNIKKTPLTHRIDSLLIALYGLIGIAVLYFYREELKKYIVIYPFLLVGFVFLFASVGCDILVERNDIIDNFVLREWFAVIEESFEVLSGCMFMVGFYRCFRITKLKKITA